MAAATWSLVQFTVPGSAEASLGFDDGAVVRLAPEELAGRTVMGLLQEWSHWASFLRDLDVPRLPEASRAELVAPLTYPRKVLCAGVNYYDHAEEMGTERPNPEAEPFFFLKTPTTTIVGPNAPITIPADGNAGIDWEAELGVVIADTCRDVQPEDALNHVAGYLVANDISARGQFPRHDAVFPAFGWDWFSHKSQDGFCPIGPGLVPAWAVDDPQALKIRLTVNGEVKQDSTTAEMVTPVAGLVAAASRVTTLEPGDIVLTGTPAGVGMPRKDFLKPGDVVTVEIECLGRITNEMVARQS